MSTSNHVGPRCLTDLPRLDDYARTDLELAANEWPAIARYLALLKQTPARDSDRLRLRRHDFWLRCALAAFHDRRTPEEICRFWSHAAEKLIADAWRVSGCDQSRFVLLALGKLGAEELNLSSDVDLVLLRDDRAPPDLKRLRTFQNLLGELTEFGYCLRVDLSLRPGGISSPALPSISEFEYHYGYHGEMWERLAYVRLRVLSGPSDLSEVVRSFSKKFSYRKHLDYTLLDELKALRSKIRREKFESRPDRYHIKLGPGGIRELELFVHALQVIHGGRNPSLQTHSTTAAIARIKAFGLLPEDECDFLTRAYWYLRDLENRLHAFDDQQTYSVDLGQIHPALPSSFTKTLLRVTARVNDICSSLLAIEEGPADEGDAFPDDLEAQKAWLERAGFTKASQDETWPSLLDSTAVSRRSERDERARLSFLKGFVTKLAEVRLDRDLGLSLLLDFVRATRAKASFFTLLNREPRVRDNLALLFSVSPYLGTLLASRPELIDEFIFRKQAEPGQDFNLLLESIAERRLLSELIAANHFLADHDLDKLCANLTRNADEIATLLLKRLSDEYGPSRIGLISMGKWGGRELGLKSDLDFIFTVPGSPSADDHKIAKRFLSRVTEPHRGGAIYSVDMRLRPSGHAGPILVSESNLNEYLSNSAVAWERQAYLRARPLVQLSFSPAMIAASRGLTAQDKSELARIHARLFSPTTPMATPTRLDLKLSRGGLADIEFTAQIALLARGEFSLDPSTSGMIQYLESVDSSWKNVGCQLRGQYESLRKVEQLHQLTTSQSGSKIHLKSDEFRRLALILDQSPEDLENSLRALLREADQVLGEVRIMDIS